MSRDVTAGGNRAPSDAPPPRQGRRGRRHRADGHRRHGRDHLAVRRRRRRRNGARNRPGAVGAPAPGRDQGPPPPPGIVEGARPQGERGRGRDPLTDDELRRAQDLALPRTPRGAAADVTGTPGPNASPPTWPNSPPSEVGLADPPRRALVSFYDYKSDRYLTKTVNLTTSKVESTDTQHGVQPPPSHAEAVEAARLLIAAPLGSGLRQDYRDATGRDLTGPDPLSVTGFVYRGRAEGERPARSATAGSTAVSASSPR